MFFECIATSESFSNCFLIPKTLDHWVLRTKNQIVAPFMCWTIVLQVSIMFVTLEKIAQTDPKYADIFLLENYAAFQNRYLLYFCC